MIMDYAWLLLAFPLIGLVLNLAFGSWWGKKVTGIVASAAVLGATATLAGAYAVWRWNVGRQAA